MRDDEGVEWSHSVRLHVEVSGLQGSASIGSREGGLAGRKVEELDPRLKVSVLGKPIVKPRDAVRAIEPTL